MVRLSVLRWRAGPSKSKRETATAIAHQGFSAENLFESGDRLVRWLFVHQASARGLWLRGPGATPVTGNSRGHSSYQEASANTEG